MAAALTAGTRHDDLRIGVIWKRRSECHGGVTGVAFNRNAWMPRRIGSAVGTCGGRAVVTGGAASGDTRVIEGSVRIEIDPTGRRVAVAAFLRCDDVICRLARCGDAVVTTAACAEHFGVIDEGRDVETQGIVTGLARIARCHVCSRLGLNCCARICRVTRNAVVRKSPVKVVRGSVGIGRWILIESRIIERYHQGDGTRA